MPCTPDHILTCAEDILACAASRVGERQETLFRTVVGRAYYAAYHQALPIAIDRGYGMIMPENRSHKRMWTHFRNKGDSNTYAEGDHLRDLRTQADYEAVRPFSERDAQESIAASRTLIESLRRQYLPRS